MPPKGDHTVPLGTTSVEAGLMVGMYAANGLPATGGEMGLSERQVP